MTSTTLSSQTLAPEIMIQLAHMPDMLIQHLQNIRACVNDVLAPKEHTDTKKTSTHHWLILHGSAVHAENWHETSSDLNLMLVVQDASPERIVALYQHLRPLKRTWPMTLEILTQPELLRSTDVFPLKYLDIQRHHVMLHGPEDALMNLSISWDHLRLRLEQQLRSLLFHLRQQLPHIHHRPEELYTFIDLHLSTLWSCLGTLMFLHQSDWWIASRKIIITQCSDYFATIDATLLHTLLAMRQRTHTIHSAAHLTHTADNLYKLLVELSAIADTLDADSSSSNQEEE